MHKIKITCVFFKTDYTVESGSIVLMRFCFPLLKLLSCMNAIFAVLLFERAFVRLTFPNG